MHGGSGSDNILCYEYSNKSFSSHKLRCSTGISGSEKSRNNTCEKISYFFTSVDIANQLLTRHSPLAPLGQVDEWTAKPSRFLNTSCLSKLFSNYGDKNTKNSVSLTDGEVQTSLEGEENQSSKRNRKLRIQWLWCWHFSRVRMKIDIWKICHQPILAVYLKDFFCR